MVCEYSQVSDSLKPLPLGDDDEASWWESPEKAAGSSRSVRFEAAFTVAFQQYLNCF